MSDYKVDTIGQKLRIILDWIVFDKKSYENNFAKKVRDAFVAFVEKNETILIEDLYNKINFNIPEGDGRFVFWRENKNKCMGAIFLHSISLHFNTKDKNGKDLIMMSLDSLVDDKKFDSSIIKNLEYLLINDLEVYGWCSLIKKINLLTDEQFEKLTDNDMILNFNLSDRLIDKLKKDFEKKSK